jgi:O-antigen ligase
VKHPKADRTGVLALAALLLVAFLCGGGGIRYGLANLAVQLTALVVMALRYGSMRQFWRDSPVVLRVLIVPALLLPLLQIVPLPQHLWERLPGHDLVARSFAAAGQDGWMTWSVFPQRTALALTALITPLAVVLAGWTVPRHHLLLAGWFVVGLGVVTVLMGLGQLNPAGSNLTIYAASEPGSFLVGTFANRNSTALWLGFCATLACLIPAPKPHPALPWVRFGLAALLVVGIILTKSRTGLVLAAIPLGLAGIRGWAWLIESRSAAQGARRGPHPALAALGVIALGAAALGGLAVAAPGRIGATLERFEAKDDPRRFIWEDAIYSAERTWPTGTGIGTFDEVAQIDESLENVSLRTSGRAHNDYLELAMEAGLAGLVVAAAWLLGCIVMAWQARRSELAWSGWAGGAFLLAIALQSITDYPLRNQTILAFAGLALLLLARAAANRRGKGL